MARFIDIIKSFQNNRPQTLCRLTDLGRRRFLEYINVLESVVTDALSAGDLESLPDQHLSEGWSPA